MTFLYEDNVLNSLLVSANLIDKLVKEAQQANDEARLIATKLVNNLAAQAVQKGPSTGSELYVQDIVSLDAFLNFLLKHQERFAGKLIVLHDATNGQSPPENQEDYHKYKDFFILKDGLIDYWRKVEAASKQVGNEVMKPLVKNLLAEINQALNYNVEPSPAEPQDNPYDAENDTQTNQKGKSVVQVPFKMNQDAIDNVSGGASNNKAKQTSEAELAKDFASIRNVLPFQSTNSLSPYDITLFINTMFELLDKHKSVIVGPMYGQFEQFSQNIKKNYNDWQGFISRASQTASNAQSARDEVPYDRGRRPFTGLETIFGSTPNAREAAQRLLQMVNLVQQSIMSINRSSKLMSLLSQDVLNHQLSEAQSYIDSLTPYAR